MQIPLVSFICWNRLGLTARNLEALLKTSDEFELYIVDSNSEDDTWEFINNVKDSRIKEVKRLDLNRGAAYAANYVMAKRKKNQFAIYVDSDSYIITKTWITDFMEVMNVYPEMGALCTVSPQVFPCFSPTATRLKRNSVEVYKSLFLAGNCACIRPDVMDRIGYFNEETGRCDNDYALRILKFTNYQIGFVPKILIDQTQYISCQECSVSNICKVKNRGTTCFKIRDNKYQNVKFGDLTVDKVTKFYDEIYSGKRSFYCSSVHDKESIKQYYYDKNMAEDTFRYYIDNAN